MNQLTRITCRDEEPYSLPWPSRSRPRRSSSQPAWPARG